MALEGLFDDHYERLVASLTLAAGSREVARDAVQDAFVAAHVRWRRFRGDLMLGLHSGVSAGVVMVVASAMLQVRQGMAAVLLLAASAIYPVGGQVLQPCPFSC